jgi:hypothetical protein
MGERMMNSTIENYILQLDSKYQSIAVLLTETIDSELNYSESKIWHSHPVWFIDGNPIVGFSQEKKGIRLMFWSGADFDEDGLIIRDGKFKDASVYYTETNQVELEKLKNWLKKSEKIQWDYKNIVKKKGRLDRIEII